MNGCIAQLVALTCHGNAVLQGKRIPTFCPANSTCDFCEYVKFVKLPKSPRGRPTETLVAKSPDEWFGYLRKQCATGIHLRITPQSKDPPDRMLAGFVGGGGNWLLEVVLPSGQSEIWMARWEVGNQKASDRRIWRVTYGQVAEHMTAPPQVDLVEVASRLLVALKEIYAFSSRTHCDPFTACFSKAIDSLTTSVRQGYHKDLVPEHQLPPEAESLLDACQNCWVFGGMGSWNDMGFQGGEGVEYNRVSEQLFATVTHAIAVAATCSIQG